MTGDTYKLFKWSVCDRGEDNYYKPPELRNKYLHGFREEPNGSLKEISTSKIVDVDGRKITTYSGSVYILQDIDLVYLQFINDAGREHDPENPIKLIK